MNSCSTFVQSLVFHTLLNKNQLALLNECTLVFWLDRRWNVVEIPTMCEKKYYDLESESQSPEYVICFFKKMGFFFFLLKINIVFSINSPYQCLFLDVGECRMDDFVQHVLDRPAKNETRGGHVNQNMKCFLCNIVVYNICFSVPGVVLAGANRRRVYTVPIVATRSRNMDSRRRSCNQTTFFSVIM
jgi:hypothetical protein